MEAKGKKAKEKESIEKETKKKEARRRRYRKANKKMGRWVRRKDHSDGANVRAAKHKVHIFTEYHSLCPLVGIGTTPPPLPQASVPPLSNICCKGKNEAIEKATMEKEAKESMRPWVWKPKRRRPWPMGKEHKEQETTEMVAK